MKHPLAVLSTRMPWGAIEASLAPKLGRQKLPTKQLLGEELLGACDVESWRCCQPDLERVIVDSTVQS